MMNTAQVVCVGIDPAGELMWSKVVVCGALAASCCGFTLVELMIVVAIVGILAAIAIPNFANAINKAHEGTTKGNLGALRSALSMYYADTEGMSPTDDLTSLTTDSKYLRSIPVKYTPPYHPAGNSVSAGTTFGDVRGDWFYFNGGSGSAQWGNVLVNCVHADLKGVVWSSY